MEILYVLFLLITILMLLICFKIVASILRYRSNAKARRLIEDIFSSSVYRKKDYYPPIAHNDFLAKDKVMEKKKQEQLEKEGVTLYQPEVVAKEQAEFMEDRIIGVMKPIGFWTRFIRNEKLGYIVNMLSAKREGTGKWVSYILAQAQSNRGKGMGK